MERKDILARIPESESLIQIGDWISFYQGGTIVIGIVMYIKKDKYIKKFKYSTHVGEVSQENILEIRSSAEKKF